MADFVLYGPSSELDVRRSYYDAIVLPGGMPGASNLAASPTLSALLKAQRQTGLWIAAICASPAVVLAPLGLLDGVTSATCYPAASFTAALPPGCDTSARVAVDVPTKTITSAGPGTAIEFALQIVASLGSEAAAREVGAALLLPTPLSLCHSPEGRVGRAPEGVYAP
jgi:4-methyl-5(b-hydroxyethyl)-thiazole monophosphate biosynthesis